MTERQAPAQDIPLPEDKPDELEDAALERSEKAESAAVDGPRFTPTRPYRGRRGKT